MSFRSTPSAFERVTVRLFPAGALLIGFPEVGELLLPPHAIERIENIAIDKIVTVLNMVISSRSCFMYTYPLSLDTLRRAKTPGEKPARRIGCVIFLDQEGVMAQI
jgi:hypothetical protein